MILSGQDVRRYILNGGLKFSPELNDDQFQQNGIDMILSDVKEQQSFVFPPTPYVFVLGTTRERVTMPNDLMAFVQIRSTWARLGFFMPPTVIDAGFEGDITLEIVRFGSSPFPLRERFAHIVFAKMTTPAEPYRGKYHNQQGITQAILDKKRG